MDRVGVAVIGTGLLGARHTRVYAEIPNAQLVAVADIQAERAKSVAQKYDAAWYTDYTEMLKDPAIQAVSVATPDHLHRDAVVACLRAGKHVLTEKPLSTKMDDAKAMVSAARGTGLTFMVNFSQRFVPEYSWIKKTIAAGTIGTPLMVQSLKHDQISVPTDMLRSWASATSPIFFMTSHDMDMIHWYIGSDPVEVTARSTAQALSAAGQATPDGVQAVVRHTGGETSLYHSSWLHPATFPSLTDSYLEIVGNEGMIYLHSRGRKVEIYSKTLNQVITFEGPHTANEMGGVLVGAFRDSLETFLNAISTGQEPMTSARRCLPVAALLYALHDSFREEKTISVTRYLDQLQEAQGA